MIECSGEGLTGGIGRWMMIPAKGRRKAHPKNPGWEMPCFFQKATVYRHAEVEAFPTNERGEQERTAVHVESCFRQSS